MKGAFPATSIRVQGTAPEKIQRGGLKVDEKAGKDTGVVKKRKKVNVVNGGSASWTMVDFTI